MIIIIIRQECLIEFTVKSYQDPLLINLSLPKCGSTSISDYCSSQLNSGHESWHSGVTDAYLKYKKGKYPLEAFNKYLLFRQIALELQIDSSTFHHFLPESVIDTFPNSLFIHVCREPIDWITSMLNMWAFFYDQHQFNLKCDDASIFRSKKWISWLNRYSKAYSKHLNVYKVHESSNLDSSNYLYKVVNELCIFWISTTTKMFNISKSQDNLYLVSLKKSHLIKEFIDQKIILPNGLNVNKFPISNRSKYLGSKKVRNYFTNDLITSVIDEDIAIKSNKLILLVNKIN